MEGGWSPPTSGVLTGTPIYIGDSGTADIDRLGPRLRGSIVLMHRPQTDLLRNDRPEPSEGDGPVQTGSPPLPGPFSSASMYEILTRLRALGAGVALSPGATEHGTVRVQGFRNTPRDAVPVVVLAAEHYNMLVRMVQAGTSPQLRIEVGARSYDNDLNSYNVLAEIPGTDAMLRDEVVLVGAHLDSWHTATGATDNADGATAV
jgi:carboxypeptidase Q